MSFDGAAAGLQRLLETEEERKRDEEQRLLDVQRQKGMCCGAGPEETSEAPSARPREKEDDEQARDGEIMMEKEAVPSEDASTCKQTLAPADSASGAWLVTRARSQAGAGHAHSHKVVCVVLNSPEYTPFRKGFRVHGSGCPLPCTQP